ncbi:hypothetical protein [Terricaulis silvestris]|uniref:Uncharacterized protein n=1 Tax=Terricaulis silvestris TaxID=2686094 RepID=A0A6I6MQN7_9CAUL|nr:hypothetical protein [Terricaulis silvestris]QGZ96471.1 hypothetical protein DSM104635_03331 [Terricaulis silvestris]
MAASSHNGGGGRFFLTTAWVAATALILLAPLVAMRMNVEGVNWTVTDFAFMGGLLVGAGLLYELATWKVTTLRTRLLIAAAIGAVVMMIWVEAAVGIFH